MARDWDEAQQASGVADKMLFLDLGSDYKDAPLLINCHMVKKIDRNGIFFIYTLNSEGYTSARRKCNSGTRRAV